MRVLKARVSILVHPTYKVVFTSVEKARRNSNTFAANQERVMLYNLLVKYFDSLVKYFGSAQSPLTVPLNKWTDFLLIRMFKTLRLPKNTEYIST
jgi:hypothetical protein